MSKMISVITVCFNSASTIEDTLLSVISQQYPFIEYIVIDGNSSDATLAILKRYQNNISVLISEPDKGMYYAMNKGITLAKGEIIGFLHADDVYASTQVIAKVAAVFNDPSIKACYSDLIYFAGNDREKIRRYWRSNSFKKGLFAKGWCPPHPTFFVRKEIYSRYGDFNTEFTLGNDIELMMRFLEKYAIQTVYIPEVLVKMRLGGISNRRFKNIIEQNKNILKAANQLDIPMNSMTFLLNKIFNRLSQFVIKPKGKTSWC